MKKQFITTFEEEFIQFIKIEAIRRGLYVNELIEEAVMAYVDAEKEDIR